MKLFSFTEIKQDFDQNEVINQENIDKDSLNINNCQSEITCADKNSKEISLKNDLIGENIKNHNLGQNNHKCDLCDKIFKGGPPKFSRGVVGRLSIVMTVLTIVVK